MSYFPTATAPRRSQSLLFSGKTLTDSFEIPVDIMKGVTDSIDDVDHEKFINNSFNMIRHLEEQDCDHPLWLNSDFTFNGEFSYLHTSYRSIFKMCLLKMISTLSPKSSPSSNYSGHYFVGPRGIGKSVMMQTCCLVVGQLLPEIATIYIDASVYHNRSLRFSLVHLLNERLTSSSVFEKLSLDSEIGDILARSAELKCTLAIFIDEAHVCYKNNTDWPDILACVSGFRSAVFLSGSDNLLVPCVKLRPTDREFLDINLGKFNHESLNSTKLTQISLRGFSTLEMYLRYFKQRRNMLKTLCPSIADMKLSVNNDKVRDEIKSLHSLTAGRMRSMHALRQGGAEYSELMDFDIDSVSKTDISYLKPFFETIQQRGSFDPFSLPRLAVGEGPGKLSQSVAYELVQKKLLSYVRNEVVTLSSPAVYLTCSREVSVFISHAESDKESVLEMVEMLKEIAVVVCSSDYETGAHMSSVKSLTVWEREQIENVGKNNHYAVIVSSSTYCDKVDTGGDVGCAREWGLLHKLKDESNKSIIYSHLGEYKDNVKGIVKDYLKDRSLLKFSKTNATSFFVRLTEPS
jgi:hypothetical protein